MREYVDPFFGSEARNLPKPEGLAASWFYIKAQIGNTHPGVNLPHDPVSALPYSGGYPTGYGVYAHNHCGTPGRIYDKKGLFGISHIQQSGTGSIGFYYNYLLTRPFLGSPVVPPIDLIKARPADITGEKATPGYYRCEVPEWETEIELVAADRSVIHRYTPSKADGSRPRGVIIDTSQGGLNDPDRRTRPDFLRIERKESTVRGSFIHYGVTWYYAAIPRESAGQALLWKTEAVKSTNEGTGGWIPIEANREEDELQLEKETLGETRAGCLWEWDGNKPFELCIGFSQDSEEMAYEYADRAFQKGFDSLLSQAEERWDEHFSVIKTEGVDEETKKLFSSCWFHASRKPVLGEKNNFLWREGPELCTDMATMWDQNKTLIPFLATFYPQKALSLVRSLYKTGVHYGQFPNGILNCTNQKTFEKQSRNLAVHIIYEIFQHIHLRGLIDRDEWIKMLPFLVCEVKREYEGITPRDMVYSHRLDISSAARYLIKMAQSLGRKEFAADLQEIADSWPEAFDKKTGYMKKGTYYEGDYVHYSFRLFHGMKERIELCGGEKRFEEMLDQFFGYQTPPVKQIGPGMTQDQGTSLNRFDGLNNEVMMETPFTYHSIGRPDKTNEIINGIREYHIKPNRGGLNGNDDSGGMTSWYVWNALGLFPMAGEGLFFISLPLFDTSEISSCGFKICRFQKSQTGGEAIYFEKLILNGEELNRSWISLEEVLAGGELEIHLTDRAGSFKVMENTKIASKIASPLDLEGMTADE